MPLPSSRCLKFSSRFFLLPPLLLLAGGCQAIGDFADDMGSHMPTIGERCEHWQCITEEGQRRSALNRQARLAGQQNAPAAAQPGQVSQQPAPPPPTEAQRTANPYDYYGQENTDAAQER